MDLRLLPKSSGPRLDCEMPRKSVSSVKLLRALTDAVERMGEEQVTSLLTEASLGSVKVRSQESSTNGARKGRASPSVVRANVVEAISRRLRELDTIQGG